MLEAFPSTQQHSELFAAAPGAPGLLRVVQSNSRESSGGTPRSREAILHIRALWGGLQGLGGGGGKLRGVRSSLAGWFRAFKGFLEWFRAAECSEGFSTA